MYLRSVLEPRWGRMYSRSPWKVPSVCWNRYENVPLGGGYTVLSQIVPGGIHTASAQLLSSWLPVK